MDDELLDGTQTVAITASADGYESASDTLDVLVGYGDETVCLHDTLYGIRAGVVETAWSIQARGKMR